MPQLNFFVSEQHFLPFTQSAEASARVSLNAANGVIDLNEELVQHKAATFTMQVNSNAMIDAGIQCGDVVIVDRMLKPTNGSVIIAALENDLLIRRYDDSNGKITLLPACSQLANINVDSFAVFSVWGVVTYVIRKV